jgi:dTDP-4-dehydrorhamnose 3,5-epimerase-like enzyme
VAKIIDLKTFKDTRGSLTVAEEPDLGFKIKRVFFIYDVQNSVRGEHGHKKTVQALTAVKGSCAVVVKTGLREDEEFLLDDPQKCLILEPKDWHYMHKFTPDCILQVLASELFDPEDYVYEQP